MFLNSAELVVCFNTIISSGSWDDISVREADGFLRLLDDETLKYLLAFFHSIFIHVDILYNVFQSRITTGVDASECVKLKF